ncbi:MAG TPA: SGNH/GDSL hydrolase family protein [Cyclobacteriaceae bacterium]|nr:SGNH/GDSL hydrolase family protein [Cyclobacteriaceae bacterium]
MAAIACVMILGSFMVNQRKKVILFGDSITEAGVEPRGYITRMSALAEAEQRSADFEFIGAGIGGNKIYDLYLRVEDDVLRHKPDIVVIYIGVNDVWHKRLAGTGTDPDKFEKFYVALIKKLTSQNIRVVLCTPAVIGEKTDFSNELDGDLNRYSNIIRSLATQNNLPLIDLRKTFLDYNLKHNPSNKESGILTSDRVHLNEQGNQLVAEAIWPVIKGM